MKRKWIFVVGLCAAIASSASMAFEEQKMPTGAAGGGAATSSTTAGSGAALTDSDVTVPRVDSGTKIRVPGLGVIGEIPRMDFGLELLYGASQPKGPDIDRNEANGVMGRVTVPLKSGR